MKNAIFKAVAIVSAFTLLDRILGFGFKVYLSRVYGAVNFGIYQVALSVFFMLITFTTSGIPLVVSRLTATAKKTACKNYEHKVVTAGLICSLIVALVICGLVLALHRFIGLAFASTESMLLLLLMLPAVIFSGVYSSFRGNLWGHKRYVAVSVIEFIEQVARILLVVILGLLGLNILRASAVSLSVSFFITLVLCVCMYIKHSGKLKNPRGHFKPLIKQAAPITIARAASTLFFGVLAITVPILLQSNGYSSYQALGIFGSSVGMAMPLLFLPLTVVGSLSYVLLPNLSKSYAKNDKKAVKKSIENAIKFSLIVAALFVPVFFGLGESLGILFYRNAKTGVFLSYSAFLLIPLSAESIVSSLMNSLSLEKKGFLNYMIGAIAAIGFLFIFWGRFRIEYLIIALFMSWTLTAILNIIAIKKKTDILAMNFLWPLAKCIIAMVPAALITILFSNILYMLPLILKVILCMIVSILFFITISLLLKTFSLRRLFKRRDKLANGSIKNRVNKIR